MSTKKTKKGRQKTVDAMTFLEELTGGPLTFAETLSSIRKGEGMSQASFARKLGISRQHLCDLEKSRRMVSPSRAARFARILGYGERQFVRLTLQDWINAERLRYRVDLLAA